MLDLYAVAIRPSKEKLSTLFFLWKYSDHRIQ